MLITDCNMLIRGAASKQEDTHKTLTICGWDNFEQYYFASEALQAYSFITNLVYLTIMHG